MKITEQILSAWIDDSLSSKKMKRVRAAVESNLELQARAEALRRIGAVLREDSFEVPVTAERMVQDVQREIRLQDSPQPVRFPRWGWVAATACACLVLMALLIPSRSGDGARVVQTEIESVDSELSGVSPMVYTDYEAGWTIVWLDDVELGSGI